LHRLQCPTGEGSRQCQRCSSREKGIIELLSAPNDLYTNINITLHESHLITAWNLEIQSKYAMPLMFFSMYVNVVIAWNSWLQIRHCFLPQWYILTAWYSFSCSSEDLNQDTTVEIYDTCNTFDILHHWLSYIEGYADLS
jgi:hypothetical protein